MNNDIQHTGRKHSILIETSDNSPASKANRTTGSTPAELGSEFVGQLAEMLNKEQDRLEQARAQADRLNKTRRVNSVAFDLD